MKVIIAGVRELPERYALPLIEAATKQLVAEHGVISEVVSGKEPTGVDAHGETWAGRRGIPVVAFPFEQGVGRAGGPIRNSKMAAYADALILVCRTSAAGEPTTPGSADMLRKARAQQKRRKFPILVVPAPLISETARG